MKSNIERILECLNCKYWKKCNRQLQSLKIIQMGVVRQKIDLRT